MRYFSGFAALSISPSHSVIDMFTYLQLPLEDTHIHLPHQVPLESVCVNGSDRGLLASSAELDFLQCFPSSFGVPLSMPTTNGCIVPKNACFPLKQILLSWGSSNW